MRNLGRILSFIIAGLFLQGCDPGAACSFYIIPKETYKQAQSNFDFKNDFETAIRIIEPCLAGGGFQVHETPGIFRKDYERKRERGNQTITIAFVQDKDRIAIAVWELGTFPPLSQSSQDIWMKLIKQFQSEFGNDRIKIDEDCIAAKKLQLSDDEPNDR